MRRRITPHTAGVVSDDRLVYAFRYADSDQFTQDFFSEPLFGSVAEARQAWPRARRAVWAATYRMHIPDGARTFDGLRLEGWEFIWKNYSADTPFPARRARQAIDRDRATVAAFVRRDARGAATIADFLAQWRADLDALTQIARELGAWNGPCWQRPVPCHRMSSARRYGHGGEVS